MMNMKTFRLFIVLLLSVASLATPSSGGGIAHAATKGQTPSTKEKQPTLGLYLSTDLFGYIYPIFAKDAYYSAEVSATMNINNRFMPVVEVGVGFSDMVSQLYEIGYRTRAPYYRIGMDYNMQYENGKPNYIYLGGRVGYTAFEYSVDAPSLIDPVWGDEVPVHFDHMSCRALWLEAVGGVRAEITKNFHMGWSLRYKYPLRLAPIVNGGPWYVPGYGASKGAAFGATYSASYYFNITPKRK